jgi:hypothetical protein
VCDTHVVEGAEHGFTSCDGTAFLRVFYPLFGIIHSYFIIFPQLGISGGSSGYIRDGLGKFGSTVVELLSDLKWPQNLRRNLPRVIKVRSG